MFTQMKKAFDLVFYRTLDLILVVCMTVMFILLFLNIMIRFLFNGAIDIAEELPRFLFIWTTFFGAIIALKENTHINVNIVVSRLPPKGKIFCWLLCKVFIFICGCYIVYGTYLQHEILLLNLSPVMMISMMLVYGITYITGSAFILHSIFNIVRFFLGKVERKEFELQMASNKSNESGESDNASETETSNETKQG